MCSLKTHIQKKQETIIREYFSKPMKHQGLITDLSTQSFWEQQAIQQRVLSDLVNRTALGIFIYPVIWPLVILSSGFYQQHPYLAWGFEVFFLLTSGLRVWQFLLLKKQPTKAYPFAMQWLSAIIICQSSIWGVFLGYSMLLNNAEFLLLMSFTAVGFGAGGANSFAPLRSLAFAYVASLLIPILLVSFIISPNLSFGLLALTFLLYSFLLSNHQHREYWKSLNNEMALQSLSYTDELTQLKNRRYFNEKLAEYCRLGDRNLSPLSLLIIDVDYFKLINDQFGHSAGDLALKEIAQRLQASLPRDTDHCARIGGEEFAVLLASTDEKGALHVAEKIRRTIKDQALTLGEASHLSTVSIGISTAHFDSHSSDVAEQLLKTADDNLYHAKHGGRNTIRVSPPIIIRRSAPAPKETEAVC